MSQLSCTEVVSTGWDEVASCLPQQGQRPTTEGVCQAGRGSEKDSPHLGQGVWLPYITLGWGLIPLWWQKVTFPELVGISPINIWGPGHPRMKLHQSASSPSFASVWCHVQKREMKVGKSLLPAKWP